MDEFTKRKISVYGINGCLDALKSDLVEINQLYIEKESPASKHKEIESLYSGLSTDTPIIVGFKISPRHIQTFTPLTPISVEASARP